MKLGLKRRMALAFTVMLALMTRTTRNGARFTWPLVTGEV
ncbi:MAG: hypothetical protein JWQ76_4832 [Ramlibacter sp.]|nr:hypothetical protein [Ramlibacter sp.]